jgi:HEAT repeat protein
MRRVFGLVVAAVCGPAALTAAQGNWQDVIRNLRHPDPEVRLASVERLGEADYVAAIEAIAPLVTDSDDRVQFAAIDTEVGFFLVERPGGVRLLGLGGPRSRVQEAFEAGPFVRAARPASSALLERLLAAVRDENARISFDAIHAIGVVAEAPLPPELAGALAAELDHYDPTIRAATARVAARLRVTEAAGPLAANLEDSSEVVRRFSAAALGHLGGGEAAPALLALARRDDGELGAEALLALARLGAPAAADLFRANVTHRDAAWRRAAVEGMGRVGGDGALDAVSGLRQSDRSAEVRLAAAFAVHRLGEVQSHVIASQVTDRDVGIQAREYLLELGTGAVPGVRSALEAATGARLRADLAHALGFIGTAEEVSLLEPLLTDRDERITRAAANAITRIQQRASN